MLQLSNLTIKAAVANQGGAMEADTILKNGRSLKSQMSRRNFLRNACFAVLLTVFMLVSCSKKDDANINLNSLSGTTWKGPDGNESLILSFQQSAFTAKDGDALDGYATGTGTYTYDYPDVTLSFDENSKQGGAFYHVTTMSGTVSGNQMTLDNNNGRHYVLTKQ